jgi:hypothetical protein
MRYSLQKFKANLQLLISGIRLTRMNTCLLVISIIGMIAFSSPSPGMAKSEAQTTSGMDLLSNGQFVWGPNVGDFEVGQFLLELGSPLAPFADIVDAWARYYSINPRVLLTLLEVRNGLLTNPYDEISPSEVSTIIEEVGLQAYEAFYEHLYTWGDMKSSDKVLDIPSPSILLADGYEFEIQADVNSASFAITDVLGTTTDLVNLNRLIASTEPGGFSETFGAMFPETDPLDTSNDIIPDSLPPDDLFQFPFPLGDSWYFNGPHNWNGGGGYPFSSMDFHTGWGPGSPYPLHYAVSAAPGSGYVFQPTQSDLPCWVKVDHIDDWTTYYYHLRKVRPPGNIGTVRANDPMGSIGEETCNGGYAVGSHLHFTLLFNGAFVSLEGVKLSGWTIHVGPPDEPYSSGYIERDGQLLNPVSLVENDYLEYYGDGTDYSLRFFGNSPGDLDRVKIRIDDPDTDYTGPPADVGTFDFTIEFWMKALSSENVTPSITCGSNDNWKLGNVLIDSSRTNMPQALGVSIANGIVAFGLSNTDGDLTLCSTSSVTDGEWHHIAVERNRWTGSSYPDGYAWLYVDGVLEAEGAGPLGDLNYTDNAIPSSMDDPFLFLGAGKDPAGEPFSGWLDELRISGVNRYMSPTFTIPSGPFTTDDVTFALYHFNEGSGDSIFDVSGFTSPYHNIPGAPSNGVRYYGGFPAGPEWVGSVPFLSFKLFFPVISK